MTSICSSLEEIAREVKNGQDVPKVHAAIESARRQIAGAGAIHESPLQRLDQELSTWLSRLPVILKEPAGRQGMAKHARFWVEELKKLKMQNITNEKIKMQNE